jgi:hypothetical protein
MRKYPDRPLGNTKQCKSCVRQTRTVPKVAWSPVKLEVWQREKTETGRQRSITRVSALDLTILETRNVGEGTEQDGEKVLDLRAVQLGFCQWPNDL